MTTLRAYKHELTVKTNALQRAGIDYEIAGWRGKTALIEVDKEEARRAKTIVGELETPGTRNVMVSGLLCWALAIPVFFAYPPAAVGLVVWGMGLFGGSSMISKVERTMRKSVRGKGKNPYTVAWLILTGTVGTIVIVGAMVTGFLAMSLLR